MSQHFSSVRVKSIQRETPDAVRITFDIPEAIQKDYAFQAGQFITLRTHIDGQEIRRTYSLCSSPLSRTWSVGIKEVTGGLFSSWANRQLKEGDLLEVMPPAGRFRLPTFSDQAEDHLIFFAAGSGITPVLSMITAALEAYPRIHCSLVFANKTRRSIMFREDLEALKNKYLGRLQLIHLLSREATDNALHQGRLDESACEALLQQVIKPGLSAAYFICGPEGFLQAVQSTLISRGVTESQIHTERFTAAIPTGRKNTTQEQHQDTSATALLKYTLDGVSAEIPMALEGISMLDAIRESGGDAPYACKGGVCCTCKAKLLSGEVTMDVVYGLEPDEIAAGYILTCQAHPLTESVTISYDA